VLVRTGFVELIEHRQGILNIFGIGVRIIKGFDGSRWLMSGERAAALRIRDLAERPRFGGRVIADSRVRIADAERLVEHGTERVIHRRESAADFGETMGIAGSISVEAGGVAGAINGGDRGRSRATFRFLRQPSRPNAPRPVAKSGRAVGSGVVTGKSSDHEPDGPEAVSLKTVHGGVLSVKHCQSAAPSS